MPGDRPEPEAAEGRDRVVEEFRLLLDAAAWRAEEYLRGAGGAEHAQHAAPEDERRPGASCGWCPVCAIAALLRGERPELSSRLIEQLAGLVELLRDSLAEHRAPPGPAAERPGEPAAESKVQRIDVRRVRGRAAASGEPGC
ncbi:hypothetical protein ACL03H_08170 [Saccharopolyspora sp. MS10]|uniref:hypothetical protein n=1 Tax=Saccharopolyspora sp. MS10 TaxID=3385973 RepID=UPI0039A03488